MQYCGDNTIFFCYRNSNIKNTPHHESDHKLLLCNKSVNFKSLEKDQEESFFLSIIHIVCNKL